MSKFLDQQGLQVLWDILKNGFQPIRRAEESEYSALFIPKDGEICIVDTVRDGVRIKIGDGTTYFNSLQYLNIGQNVIVRGFYFEGKFYYNSVHTQQMTGAINTLYIDLPTGDLYYYEEGDYI